ncbi:MAG: hypothetical protein GY854_26790 [Deltaproteobacteria bacterium]|nr:hypothetical protein [Deltaproteobacteria bacterium]
MKQLLPCLFLAAASFCLLTTHVAFADGVPRWTIPRFAEPPATWDGNHVVEGTAVTPPWGWHARISAAYLYGLGLSDRASGLRGAIGTGVGFPANLEVGLALPVGFTFGVRENDLLPAEPSTLEGMSEDGPGVGDLTTSILWSVFDAGRGGFGLLFGLKAGVPTGNHERLMGEGGFSAEPFGVVAFQMLGVRLSLNLGYRFRPEHIAFIDDTRFEQDDDLVWRVGIRIPRKHDVAWSLEAEGTIGVATNEGFWPSYTSRPVWACGGVDFPVARQYRLGILVGAGIVGEAAPTFTLGMSFSFLPALPDEDGDGVGGMADECPLLEEDKDGFEDGDGCPDLDNDNDGFPDDEDQCPLEPAGGFSEDGC